MSTKEKISGACAHLMAFLVFLFPFGNIIGPLLFWLFVNNQSTFIDNQGKESINFQINITIWFLIIFVSMFVLPFLFLILFLLSLYGIVMIIVAASYAGRGIKYKYPLTIKII